MLNCGISPLMVLAVLLTFGIEYVYMKMYCLTVGAHESDKTFVINDLSDFYQLYGAMRSAVESGNRLFIVYVVDCD